MKKWKNKCYLYFFYLTYYHQCSTTLSYNRCGSDQRLWAQFTKRYVIASEYAVTYRTTFINKTAIHKDTLLKNLHALSFQKYHMKLCGKLSQASCMNVTSCVWTSYPVGVILKRWCKKGDMGTVNFTEHIGYSGNNKKIFFSIWSYSWQELGKKNVFWPYCMESN